MRNKQFEHLNVPNHWRQYYTRYPEGYTILESLLNWVQQVNDMVENVNDWNDYLDDFVDQFDDELKSTVSTILHEWQQSGELDVIITEALETQIDNVQFQLEQLVFNIEELGAVGDGETDNTAVIAEAIEKANGGGSVFFPPGEYKTSNLILSEIESVTLFGQGATLIFGGATDFGYNANLFRFENSKDITIKNLSFKGSLFKEISKTNLPADIVDNPDTREGRAIIFVDCDRVYVFNSFFTDFSYNIRLQETNDFLIENCTIVDGRSAIHILSNSKNGVIRRCLIKDMRYRFFEERTGGNGVLIQDSEHVQVEHVTCYRVFTNTFRSDDVKNVTFRHCRGYQSRRSPFLIYGDNGSDVKFLYCIADTLTENTFWNGDGKYKESDGTQGYFLFNEASHDVIIDNFIGKTNHKIVRYVAHRNNGRSNSPAGESMITIKDCYFSGPVDTPDEHLAIENVKQLSITGTVFLGDIDFELLRADYPLTFKNNHVENVDRAIQIESGSEDFKIFQIENNVFKTISRMAINCFASHANIVNNYFIDVGLSGNHGVVVGRPHCRLVNNKFYNGVSGAQYSINVTGDAFNLFVSACTNHGDIDGLNNNLDENEGNLYLDEM